MVIDNNMIALLPVQSNLTATGRVEAVEYGPKLSSVTTGVEEGIERFVITFGPICVPNVVLSYATPVMSISFTLGNVIALPEEAHIKLI